MVSSEFVRTFTQITKSPNPDLATVALLIARLEYPKLDASPYLDQLDRMGEAASPTCGWILESQRPARIDSGAQYLSLRRTEFRG